MKGRKFHIADIISVTTDRNVAFRGFEGTCKILDYMCGQSLYTHQVPRAITECIPWLLKQFPMLSAERAKGVTKKRHKEWLLKMETKYGQMHAVLPLPRDKHAKIDP